MGLLALLAFFLSLHTHITSLPVNSTYVSGELTDLIHGILDSISVQRNSKAVRH